MRQTADFERLKLTEIGLATLEDEVGLAICETALQCGEPQLMGLVGQHAKVRSLIASAEEQPGDAQGMRTGLRFARTIDDHVFEEGSAKPGETSSLALGPRRDFED